MQFIMVMKTMIGPLTNLIIGAVANLMYYSSSFLFHPGLPKSSYNQKKYKPLYNFVYKKAHFSIMPL